MEMPEMPEIPGPPPEAPTAPPDAEVDLGGPAAGTYSAQDEPYTYDVGADGTVKVEGLTLKEGSVIHQAIFDAISGGQLTAGEDEIPDGPESIDSIRDRAVKKAMGGNSEELTDV